MKQPIISPPKLPVDDGLNLWLPCQADTGRTAYDYSGNGKHATLSSNVTWASAVGKEGGALAFDGTPGQNVSIADIGINYFRPDGQEFTVLAWIYPTSLTGSQSIITKRQNDAQHDGYRLSLSGAKAFHVIDETSFIPAAAQGTDLIINTWSFVGMRVTGPVSARVVEYLLNGAVDYTSAPTNIGQMTPVAADFYIGCDRALTNIFNGQIKGIREYFRAVTIDEFRRIYESEL